MIPGAVAGGAHGILRRLTPLAAALLLALASACTPATISEPPQPAAQELFYRCPDAVTFRIIATATQAQLFMAGTRTLLSRQPAASGEKYQGGATLFWSKGERATLEREGRSYGTCTRVWAKPLRTEAIDRGVRIRALGQEPGWLVEISDSGLLLVTDYGRTRRTFAAPAVESTLAGGTLLYRINQDNAQIALLLTQEWCQDSMSGEYFSTRAVLTIDATSYAGCADMFPSAD